MFDDYSVMGVDLSARKNEDHPLLKAKLVYFFYEAISKTLPQHLAGYYKHTLLLSPHQVSLLLAARYFAQLFGSPVMGSIGDRLRTFRNILTTTLIALLVTYLVVPLVEPIDGFNCKEHLQEELNATMVKPINKFMYGAQGNTDDRSGHMGHSLKHTHYYHGGLMYGLFYSWPFEAWAYEETDNITRKVFVTLLLVTLIGEFFASPGETFIDLYTIQALRNETHKLGWQTIFGVLGSAILSMSFLLVKLRSDQRGDFSDFCSKGHFFATTPYLFVVYGLVAACIIMSFFLHFNRTDERDREARDFSCLNPFKSKCCKAMYVIFKNPAYASFAFIVIFCGFSTATRALFIYSYIHDLGGTAVLIIVISAVHMVSNSIALFLSPWLLRRFGNETLIAAGLFVNALTFFTYAIIENPWLTLLVEPFDGICHSLSWVAILTYVGAPPNIGAALQGLTHGLYRGLGVAVGYFVVSIFILKFGYMALFVGLGLAYFFIFGGYITVLHFWPAPTIGDEYTNYARLFDDDEDLSEGEAVDSFLRRTEPSRNASKDLSFMK